jgi:hypothetical protein
MVREAVAVWPGQLEILLGTEKAKRLVERFDTLGLVEEALA